MMLLLFSFSIISFFVIAVPYANAGPPPPSYGACCGCSDCDGGTSGMCDSPKSLGECEIRNGIYQGDGTTCDPDPCGCVATVKCVCESKFSGATRVVPCPADPFPPGFNASFGPEGTLGVDCGRDLSDSPALCENLDIHCKWWEKPNCLLTLPIRVPPQPTPTPEPD